jgi:hypothetical protein
MLREALIIGIGFQLVQADPVATKLSHQSVIVIEPEGPGTLTLSPFKLDATTGQFQATGLYQDRNAPRTCGNGIKGQFTGSILQFSDQYCSGFFRWNKDHFDGTVTVTEIGKMKAQIPVE